ncbi:hypothetical protein [Streptomyces sp. NPDC059009]|uniref:hypothetical protein n=1 Tax=Streptomyces sp. NPDC059009 TaxID=3346694 RepID=UPI0036A50819
MTDPVRLETRPEVLRRRADALWERHEQGVPLTEGELDALAEAHFRLGVQPDLDPVAALTLLARAQRADPANPKHAYHIGRIYLERGRLELALEWLTTAADLAPANHRVWAHIYLVHQGLHERRAGDSGYSGELQERAESIAEAVREGRDDLKPEPELERVSAQDPPSEPPLPLLRPGECRWSGIRDLAVESRLRGRTTERTRDALAAELERIAGLAAERPGGIASFTVLAVQWMVCGYPPATARRLARVLPPRDGPDRNLLDLVCELFEADEAGLPARLAGCLDEGLLPDVLIALIHQRRLMRRPLHLADLGAYTAARQFTGGEPEVHLASMRRAVRALSAEPAAALADVAAPEEDAPEAPSGPDERLEAFERVAARISGAIKDAYDLTKELGRTDVSSAESHGRVGADHAVLTEAVRRIAEVKAIRLKEFQTFISNVPAGLRMPREEFMGRVAECESQLQTPLGTVKNLLHKKIAKRLSTHRPELPAAEPARTSPSERALALQAAVAATAPDPSPPAAVTLPEPTPPEGTPADQVSAAVAEVRLALDRNVDAAWETLRAYPPRLQRRTALVLLRSYLNGHVAETRHRMGQRTVARRHWQSMLAESPMQPAVLHNLAVAHTSAGDTAPAAQAWGRYLEALYAQSVLAGAPGRGAAFRADVHRTLAGSFGTATLCGRRADGDRSELRLRGFPAELASPAKVTLALAHLRLADLNQALSYRSPVLRLGVPRSVGQERLDEARDARLEFVTTACAVLPARVRGPFEELCRTAIHEAHEDASRTSGRTRKATDEAEEEAHMAWGRERILWKVSIAQELAADADWPVTEASGDIIAGLRLLDGLRLDSQDQTLLRTARQLGVQEDPFLFLERHNNLSDHACKVALERIFHAAQQPPGSSADFPERFRRIGRSWWRNTVPHRYLELLDDPQPVYHSSVEKALAVLSEDRDRLNADQIRAVEAAVPIMERWTGRLPGATGPGRVLANLLYLLGREDKARQLFEATNAAAFAGGAVSLEQVTDEIRLEMFSDAVAHLRKYAAGGRHGERVRTLTAEAYRRWIHSARRRGRSARRGPDSAGLLPAVEDIRSDLARWSEPEAVLASRTLVVEATLVEHELRPGDAQDKQRADGLRQLWEGDEENSFARYELVLALYRCALGLRLDVRRATGSDRAALRAEFITVRTECATHATGLVETSDADALHEHALWDDKRRDKIESILERLGERRR